MHLAKPTNPTFTVSRESGKLILQRYADVGKTEHVLPPLVAWKHNVQA